MNRRSGQRRGAVAVTWTNLVGVSAVGSDDRVLHVFERMRSDAE